MTRHVIILCQGQQTRLPMLATPKQLLLLQVPTDEYRNSVFDEKSILERTMEMVWHMDPAANVCVVGGEAIEHAVQKLKPLHNTWMQGALHVVTLTSPGNSSLKGLAQILAVRARDKDRVEWSPVHSQTVVLFGDAVYSWDCLSKIMSTETYGNGPARPVYVTSGDISPSGGELWGLAWRATGDDAVLRGLHEALDNHPPFDSTYQPGQMRRLMKYAVGFQFGVDDYTRDIDVPAHLDLLPGLALLAKADDAKHFMEWT